MASKSTTTISISALTAPLSSVPKETWKFTWKLDEMRHLVAIAMQKESKRNIIAKLPFEIVHNIYVDVIICITYSYYFDYYSSSCANTFLQGSTFGQEVSLEWVLKVFNNDTKVAAEDNVENSSDEEPSKTIGLEMNPINPPGFNTVWQNVFFFSSIQIILDDEVLHEQKDGIN